MQGERVVRVPEGAVEGLCAGVRIAGLQEEHFGTAGPSMRLRGMHECATDAAPRVLVADIQAGQLGAGSAVADGQPRLDAGEADHGTVALGEQRDLTAGAGSDALGQPVRSGRWTAEGGAALDGRVTDDVGVVLAPSRRRRVSYFQPDV